MIVFAFSIKSHKDFLCQLRNEWMVKKQDFHNIFLNFLLFLKLGKLNFYTFLQHLYFEKQEPCLALEVKCYILQKPSHIGQKYFHNYEKQELLEKKEYIVFENVL